MFQRNQQYAVEGMSFAAISYYVLSFAGTGLNALHVVHFPLDSDLIKGVLIPPVVLLVLRATRRSKHAAQQ